MERDILLTLMGKLRAGSLMVETVQRDHDSQYCSAAHTSHRSMAQHLLVVPLSNPQGALCPGPPEPVVVLRPPGDDRPQALSAPAAGHGTCRALTPDAHKTRLEARCHQLHHLIRRARSELFANRPPVSLRACEKVRDVEMEIGRCVMRRVMAG